MSGKTVPAQVAECEDYLVWALVGAGCNDQMQVAQGQGLVRGCALKPTDLYRLFYKGLQKYLQELWCVALCNIVLLTHI